MKTKMGLANVKQRTLTSRTLVGVHPVADQFPAIELLIQSKALQLVTGEAPAQVGQRLSLQEVQSRTAKTDRNLLDLVSEGEDDELLPFLSAGPLLRGPKPAPPPPAECSSRRGRTALSYCVSLLTSETAMLLLLLLLQTVRTFMLLLL